MNTPVDTDQVEDGNLVDQTCEVVSAQPIDDLLMRLHKMSVNNKVDDMRSQARNAEFVLGRLALAGQITVFYAAPNTGKTLITLYLVAEAIANGTTAKNVYHINLDDSFEGLIEKADLGNRYGFSILGPDTFTRPNEQFRQLVEELIREGCERDTIFILDTVKKFVDVMDKKASSHFMSTCRMLSAAGGTVIALAHVNKKQSDSGTAIPAGTSDILDDCDCAYVMDIFDEKPVIEGKIRTVEFLQKKARGPVVESATYSYQTNGDADYESMFNSVRQIDGSEADKMRRAKAIEVLKSADLHLITKITSFLDTTNAKSQKEVLCYLENIGGISRRSAIACLKKWSCAAEEGGVWVLRKGDSNSNLYSLLS